MNIISNRIEIIMLRLLTWRFRLLLILLITSGCNNDKRCKQFFFPSGNLKKEICKEEEGSFYFKRVYNEDGNIHWEAVVDSMEKRQGNYIEYFKNGKIKTEGEFENDSLEGILKTYFENGNIEQECSYKQGKRDGNCIFYYPDKTLKLASICEKGVTLYFKEYDTFGDLKDEFHGLQIVSLSGDTINSGESYKAKIVLVGQLSEGQTWNSSVLFAGPGMESPAIKKAIPNRGQEAFYESPKLSKPGTYFFFAISAVNTLDDSLSLEKRIYVK